MNKADLNIRNTIIYIIGMISIALGVVLMLRSNLGSSSWDSLHYALSMVLPITIGNATILVAALFTIAIIYLNKSYKYLYMFIPIFIVGYLIDGINLYILDEFIVTHIFTRTLTFYPLLIPGLYPFTELVLDAYSDAELLLTGPIYNPLSRFSRPIKLICLNLRC